MTGRELDDVPLLDKAPAHALFLAGPARGAVFEDPTGEPDGDPRRGGRGRRARPRDPGRAEGPVASPPAAAHPAAAHPAADPWDADPHPVGPTSPPIPIEVRVGGAGTAAPTSLGLDDAAVAGSGVAGAGVAGAGVAGSVVRGSGGGTTVVEPSASAPPDGIRGDRAEPDWGAVRGIRQKAAQELSEQLRDEGAGEAERRRLGREVVERLVAEHTRALAASGEPLLDLDQEALLVDAVLDALFGLGRLQPLVDDEEIENIEITGHDQVRLLMRDGRILPGRPVADSDEELVDFLQFLASRGTASGAERPFSQANPRLHLSLPGRGRLAASAWVTARPVVRIRRQTVQDVTLDDLCDLGSITPVVARFLEAAMRARLNLVVSGEPGVGKTTFVRALAAAIPPYESLATLESEWELYLDRLPSRVLRPVEAFEARPGTGEIGPDGRRSGAVSLEELFEDVLRHNVDRIIVGEVRGSEALAMFRAMQAGRGSLSTIHAKNARDTAQRLVTCLAGSGAAADYAWGLVATNIDLVLHLRATVDPRTGRRRRYLGEIVEIQPGEGPGATTRPAFTTLFAVPRGGHTALPATPPTPAVLDTLVDHGFDPRLWGDRLVPTSPGGFA